MNTFVQEKKVEISIMHNLGKNVENIMFWIQNNSIQLRDLKKEITRISNVCDELINITEKQRYPSIQKQIRTQLLILREMRSALEALKKKNDEIQLWELISHKVQEHLKISNTLIKAQNL